MYTIVLHRARFNLFARLACTISNFGFQWWKDGRLNDSINTVHGVENHHEPQPFRKFCHVYTDDFCKSFETIHVRPLCRHKKNTLKYTYTWLLLLVLPSIVLILMLQLEALEQWRGSRIHFFQSKRNGCNRFGCDSCKPGARSSWHRSFSCQHGNQLHWQSPVSGTCSKFEPEVPMSYQKDRSMTTAKLIWWNQNRAPDHCFITSLKMAGRLCKSFSQRAS